VCVVVCFYPEPGANPDVIGDVFMAICVTSQANGYRETETFHDKANGSRSPSNDAYHDNTDDAMESNAVAMDTTVTDPLEGKLQTLKCRRFNTT